MKKKWNEYLWIYSLLYFILGFFNILFAWLGMIEMFVPLIFAIGFGNKGFCNSYCGRGQLLRLLGTKCKLSKNRSTPRWMSSKYFRYGFLIFFFTMFFNMIYQTYLVFGGVKNLSQTVKLIWMFKVPWAWAYTVKIPYDWVAQYSFGLYSTMLTSFTLGLISMRLYKPRTWCVFCPMGTMTHGICKLKNK